jgi:hypothetical protein
VLDHDVLHGLAQSAVAEPGADQRALLQLLRFEPGFWLERGADEEPYRWIALILSGGASLAAAPSLSRKRTLGFVLLRRALELWGWSGARIDLLIGGNRLDTLLSDLRFPVEPEWVGGFLSVPGWLRTMEAVAFGQDLRAATMDSARMAAAAEAIAEECRSRGEDPATVLRDILDDAQAMLAAGSGSEVLLLGVFD